MCVWGGGGEEKLASLQESGPTKETEEEQTEILRVRVVWGVWVTVCVWGGGGVRRSWPVGRRVALPRRHRRGTD